MSTRTAVVAYVVGLALVFALAWGLGQVVGPLDAGTSHTSGARG